MFIVSALSNMVADVRCLSSQKLNHLASYMCWCIVLLEHDIVKVKLSHRHVLCTFFCGCSCKTSRICHQQTRL